MQTVLYMLAIVSVVSLFLLVLQSCVFNGAVRELHARVQQLESDYADLYRGMSVVMKAMREGGEDAE